MARPDRGPLLTVSALLMGLLAISNFSKPFAPGPEVGFVFLGRRLSGTPNAIIGPLFGLYLLLYAMGIGYAVYVVLNLILFTVRDPTAFRNGLLFGLVYSVVAIGVSGGTAYLLAQRRAALT